MLAAIRGTRERIDLETYIFADDRIGNDLLQALVESARRGVRIRVLVDAYGSFPLIESYFAPLKNAGGEIHFFNPLRFGRFGVRDHRKLLICDNQAIFVGGANIADSYDGDGVTQGWFDLMIKVESAELAVSLTEEFEQVFRNADFKLRGRHKLRAFRPIRQATETKPRIFAVSPGRGAGLFQRALQADLRHARAADFIVPYFLPGRRLRKRLRQIVQRGGRVRLILPAKCDVPAARAAAMFHYARLLRNGVEIYEYQPQILHAKLYRVDGIVYAGFSNLDPRSFKLNYELMLRLADDEIAVTAKGIFDAVLQHSARIELDAFRKSQNFWRRWKNRWAHFLLARVDPLIALRQLDSIPARKPRPPPRPAAALPVR